MEEQKFEIEKLRRELQEKMAEVTRIKANLQSSEKVGWDPVKAERPHSTFGVILAHHSCVQNPEAYVCLCLPGVAASEQLNGGSAGREGGSDAICE